MYTCVSMDLRPTRLRVTFCDAKLLVCISPLKTILDLKNEVARVYHMHYPQKMKQHCEHVQNSDGFLICDDYHVGLVFDTVDSAFALTGTQSVDNYQTKSQELPVMKTTTRKQFTPTPFVEERTDKGKRHSDMASETDCSNDLIPQVLEGSLPPSASAAANVTVATQESSTKKPATYFTDSSLSDSDSDALQVSTAKHKDGNKSVKISGDESSKSTPKRRGSRKLTEEQTTTAGNIADDVKDSAIGRTADRIVGHKFQLLPTDTKVITSSAAIKKLKMKRRHPSNDAQVMLSERKTRKRSMNAISKKELELANTSSQSVILDDEKLWTK